MPRELTVLLYQVWEIKITPTYLKIRLNKGISPSLKMTLLWLSMLMLEDDKSLLYSPSHSLSKVFRS